jgi:hypothetical protein
MKTSQTRVRANESGQARLIIIAVLCFAIGVAAGGWWFSQKPLREVAMSSNQQEQRVAATPMEATVNVTQSPQPAAEPINPETIEAVKRVIPNVTLVSVEQGTLILRKAALAEFEQAAHELQARQKKAEQRFIQDQGKQSSEQQMIAAKELQQLQSEQMDQLKKIAANSESRIDALKQLKGQPQ